MSEKNILETFLQNGIAPYEVAGIQLPRDTIESIMFVTSEHNLINSNPKQPELFNTPVAEVSKPELVVKAVN